MRWWSKVQTHFSSRQGQTMSRSWWSVTLSVRRRTQTFSRGARRRCVNCERFPIAARNKISCPCLFIYERSHSSFWPQGIPFGAVHNASIMNAVGACGLQLYNFGRAYKSNTMHPKLPHARRCSCSSLRFVCEHAADGAVGASVPRP